jgi:hypothetical protein
MKMHLRKILHPILTLGFLKFKRETGVFQLFDSEEIKIKNTFILLFQDLLLLIHRSLVKYCLEFK